MARLLGYGVLGAGLLLFLNGALGGSPGSVAWAVQGAKAGAEAVGDRALQVDAVPSFADIFLGYDLPMLLIDPGSGAIVDANPAAAAFYGYSRAVLQAMRIQQINTFTDEQVAAEREAALTSGRTWFVFRHRRADGDIRTVEVHSRPFEFGTRALLLSVVQDITPGRSREQELWHYQGQLEETVDRQVAEIEAARERQELLLGSAVGVQMAVIVWLVVSIRRRQRLEAERQQLLTALQERTGDLERLSEVMAHHFQEPVRRLVTFSQKLIRTTTGVEDSGTWQTLGFIEDQARHLFGLVSDAQRYLELDRGTDGLCGEAMTAEADSGMALSRALAVTGLVAGRDVSLPECLPWVRMPMDWLEDGFAILLDNARRYGNPDRRLQIGITVKTEGGWATFRVSDNGSGIPPEYREQVFGLFVRLVPNTVPGTGMGLALVRKMVQRVGGAVAVEDGMDGGACIAFTLPVVKRS